MNAYEYYEAKKCLELQEMRVKRLNRHAPNYKKELKKFIELLITVKGHAWCMEVKRERKKMSRLLADVFMQY